MLQQEVVAWAIISDKFSVEIVSITNTSYVFLIYNSITKDNKKVDIIEGLWYNYIISKLWKRIKNLNSLLEQEYWYNLVITKENKSYKQKNTKGGKINTRNCKST